MLCGVLGEEGLLSWVKTSRAALYVDSDLFPSPTVGVPGFLLFSGAFDDADTIPGAFIAQDAVGLYPSLIFDVDAIPDFTKTVSGVAIVPPLWSEPDVIYPADFTAQALAPALFIDIDDVGNRAHVHVGKPALYQYIPLSDGVVDFDVIYGAIVEQGRVTLAPRQAAVVTTLGIVFLGESTANAGVLPGVVIDETASGLSPPTLSYLRPNAVSSDDAIPVTTIQGPIPAGLVTDTDTVFAPSVGGFLRPLVVSDGDALFAPAVIRVWPLQPGSFSDADNILGPTFTTPGRMGLVTDVDAIPAATVLLGALQPVLVADTDVFYTPYVGVQVLQPSAIVDFADTFYVPTFNAIQTLVPTIWIDSENFLSPDTIEGQPPLQPLLLASDDAILPWPTVTAGPVTLLPGVTADSDAFLVPHVTVSGRQAAIISALGVTYVSESTSNETGLPGMFVDEGG